MTCNRFYHVIKKWMCNGIIYLLVTLKYYKLYKRNQNAVTELFIELMCHKSISNSMWAITVIWKLLFEMSINEAIRVTMMQYSKIKSFIQQIRSK